MMYVQTQPTEFVCKIFCISYPKYLQLIENFKNHDIFKRWSRKDAVGDSPVPIELLLLGFFCYCGHIFTMDDLEESTTISAETNRQCMIHFLEYGSTVL